MSIASTTGSKVSATKSTPVSIPLSTSSKGGLSISSTASPTVSTPATITLPKFSRNSGVSKLPLGKSKSTSMESKSSPVADFLNSFVPESPCSTAFEVSSITFCAGVGNVVMSIPKSLKASVISPPVISETSPCTNVLPADLRASSKSPPCIKVFAPLIKGATAGNATLKATEAAVKKSLAPALKLLSSGGGGSC